MAYVRKDRAEDHRKKANEEIRNLYQKYDGKWWKIPQDANKFDKNMMINPAAAEPEYFIYYSVELNEEI